MKNEEKEARQSYANRRFTGNDETAVGANRRVRPSRLAVFAHSHEGEHKGSPLRCLCRFPEKMGSQEDGKTGRQEDAGAEGIIGSGIHHSSFIIHHFCAILALVFLANLAAAGEGVVVKDAKGVTWRRFDPKTGKKVFDVSAKEAVVSEDGKTHLITEPRMLIRGSEYDVNVSSESGSVRSEGGQNSAFTLKGSVVVKIADPGKTTIRIDELTWSESKRLLESDSPVEVIGADISITGTGVVIEPEQGSKDVRLITLEKDVKARISPTASKSALFSAISGSAEKPDPKAGPPMDIVSDGPLTINRNSSIVSFTDNVRVVRGSATITCESLDMVIDPATRTVTELKCAGGVRAVDGEDGASGEAFSWDASTGLAEIAGKAGGEPARTWRGSAVITAPLIWISQKDLKVLWSGGTRLHAPAEGKTGMLRFGGGTR